MTTRALRSIYQIKVTLLGTNPPVWRRLLVTGTDNLEDVHAALQIVMGWTNSHLHEFVKGHDRYGEPDDEFPMAFQNEKNFRLQQLLNKAKDKLLYVYDYGDSWEHHIVLEKILAYEHDTLLPLCLEGEGACPPEDIGGIPGYGMFLEAISDPSHPDNADMLDWVGGWFDPEHFDVVEANQLLRDHFS